MIGDIDQNMIKGIIIAHSNEGATIDTIMNDYMEIVRKSFYLADGTKEDIYRYLRNIDGVYSVNNGTHDERLWFVKYNVSKDIQNLKRQKEIRAHGMPSVSINNVPFGTSNIGYPTNDNIAAVEKKNNRSETNNNVNRQLFGHVGKTQPNIASPTPLQMINVPHNSGRQKWFQRTTVRPPNRNRLANPQNGMASVNTSKSSNSRNSLKINDSDCAVSLYDYELMGDDFFLEVAHIELRKKFVKHTGIKKCGHCISGQSIHAAKKYLQKMSNTKIILNVGSIDILHGRDLVDMRHQYVQLVNVCNQQNIELTITTLAPLANTMHSPDIRRKVSSFNHFLVKQFSNNYKVIDIYRAMVGDRGQILFDCYQPESKYVTGSNQPHALWNRIGRQRILKFIKKHIVD